MKKIKMIYKRQFAKTGEVSEVENEYIPEYLACRDNQLVLSLKIDGTACMIKDGKFYKRYDNKNKPIVPKDGILCYKTDQKSIYWIPVTENDTYHWLGWDNLKDKKDGTYELVGPKVNSNRHNLENWYLVPHHELIINGYLNDHCNVTKDDWRRIMSTSDEYFNVNNPYRMYGIEGFVLWDLEKDEPMFKIRKDDLGGHWKDRNFKIDLNLDELRIKAKDIYGKYKKLFKYLQI